MAIYFMIYLIHFWFKLRNCHSLNEIPMVVYTDPIAYLENWSQSSILNIIFIPSNSKLIKFISEVFWTLPSIWTCLSYFKSLLSMTSLSFIVFRSKLSTLVNKEKRWLTQHKVWLNVKDHHTCLSLCAPSLCSLSCDALIPSVAPLIHQSPPGSADAALQ